MNPITRDLLTLRAFRYPNGYAWRFLRAWSNRRRYGSQVTFPPEYR